MKTTENPNLNSPQKGPGSTPNKDGATNPKKPNNDPDQTPDREVENVPKAKPGTQSTPQKQKIGFKK